MDAVGAYSRRESRRTHEMRTVRIGRGDAIEAAPHSGSAERRLQPMMRWLGTGYEYSTEHSHAYASGQRPRDAARR